MSDNIKVVVKVRPLIPREKNENLQSQWRVDNNTLYQLDHSGNHFGPPFTFDKVYDENTPTIDVYNDIAKPIVEAATTGINGTIFAYGQTSSGKTYTMSGGDDCPGIIPLAVYDLFDFIKNKEDRDFLLRVSYMEIYNETIKDLLDTKKTNIKIHDTFTGGVKLDVTEVVTSSPEEIFEYMKKGQSNRHIGSTNMNEESSRSHSIFQITIESREHSTGDGEDGCVNVSTLNLVDLAGSERSGQTGASGKRFKEGTHINKSLSTLGLVIKQLADNNTQNNKFANFRDSKLTRILQNSLGGNAKTSIICAVTPAAAEETVSTLQFANRAKAIKNKPEVNAVATDKTMIQRLTKKLSSLQTELEIKKNLEQDNRILQDKIKELQRQILNGFGDHTITSELSRLADRRKTWAAPRRMTIDTLHTIEEIPSNPVLKFRTPMLKYNPSLFPEQLPAQNTSKLPTVSEEAPSGRSTPPPARGSNDKKVNFSELQDCDEIIEVDSDNDDAADGSCSPYHKCFDATKTPPCVLRENAKKAEKNYQDIVELTGREKIYQPEVVELMHKLEQNTNVIAKLEEHVNMLNEKVSETTSENDSLKDKISKAEQAIETISSEKMTIVMNTEKQIQELNTKLTDAEVMYETLKRKSTTREEELLSQLNEIRGHKNNGKSLSRTLDKDNLNFMDLSKDISLVNSDVENSIIDEEAAAPLNNLLINLNSQLSSKTELVLELEAKLHAQQIEMLNSNSDNETLKVAFASLNEKLNVVENENATLKSSIDTLNSTIKIIQENLEAANRDNDSYNELVKGLQLKIKEKEMATVNLDDSTLETMIANEEKFIANNENLKNIIHSLKIMVDARNKEILSLRAISSDLDNSKTDKNLTSYRVVIEGLENEVHTLKQELNEKLNDLKKLTEENQSLTRRCDMQDDMQILNNKIEEANKQNKQATSLLEKTKDENKLLTAKIESDSAKTEDLQKQLDHLHENLTKLTEENKALTQVKSDYALDLKKLKDSIEKVSVEKAEITAELDLIKNESHRVKTAHSNSQFEFTIKLQELQNEVDRLSQKISGMETEIGNKEKEILSLREFQFSQEQANNVSAATDKILAFISRLTGTEHETTEISNIEVMVQSLTYCADSLAETAEVIEFERGVAAKESSEQLNQLELNTYNYQSVISALEAQVATLTEESQTSLHAVNELRDTNSRQQMEVEEKTKEITQLKYKLQATISDYEKLQKAVEDKNQALLSAEAKVSDLVKEAENLTILLQERNDCDKVVKRQIDIVDSFLKEISKGCSHVHIGKLDEGTQIASLSNPYTTLIQQLRVLTQNIANRDEILQNIIDKLTILIETTKLENKSDFESNDNNLEKYKQIPDILDNVIVHMKTLEQDLSDKNLDMAALTEATAQILELKSANHKLENELHDYKENYLKAMSELDSINRDNKSLNRSLLECNELLEKLQSDLVSKKYELEKIEKSTQKFKDDFTDINQTMNRKIKGLEADNEMLRRQLETLIELQPTVDDPVKENKDLRRSLTQTIKQAIRAPRSLTSISLDRIIEVMAVNEWRTDASTSESTHSLFNMSNKASSEFCEYNTYNVDTELKETKEDNAKLKALVELLKTANKQLIEEQHEVRKEVNLLLEPAIELQKKISNHRTNISTLTATTYAENKALQSQVKVLQYYHSRLHKVVQKDLLSFKKRLQELFTVLKIEAENNANNSFKRFSLPDVLDKNKSSSATFRNDSTLDGDLLMLDNNDTLASVVSTLVGHAQDFDKTQSDAEVTYNTNLDYTAIDQKFAFNDIEKQTNDNLKIHEALEILEKKATSHINESNDKNTNAEVCENCKYKTERLNTLVDALNKLKEEKAIVEEKYNQLKLEVPSSESLVRKLSALEKEHKNKVTEIISLTNKLSNTNRELKQVQEENDALSNQIMDHISEVDDLRKEIENITTARANIEKKCFELEKSLELSSPKVPGACSQCLTKKKTLQEFSETESLLNRSQRGLDTSLRHSKICTLQNELQASREDCKKITEEFATIKDQLDRSNLSINQTMDDSMGESNIFTLTKDFDSVDTQTTSKFATNMPNILEEKSQDIYTMDKTDCFNYFFEKTGAQKENLDRDCKIVDVMKMLYNNLMSKHNNEVENLLNKLRTFDESNTTLERQISAIKVQYANVHKEFENKTKSVESLTKTVEYLTEGVNTIKADLTNTTDSVNNTKLVSFFKENILNIIDRAFTLSTTPVFEYLIDSIATKHQSDLSSVMEKYTTQQEQMENLVSELSMVNENLLQMKQQLTDREKDYNLLKLQKDKVYEISNAVTLDIVKKEQELSETITKGCRKLLENNLIDTKDVDLCIPLKKNIGSLFEFLIQNTESTIQEKFIINTEKENLMTELASSKSRILEKEQELDTLKSENVKNMELHRSVSQKLLQKESELNSMLSLREENEKLLSEQSNNVKLIQKLNDEITTLEETVAKKQTLLHSMANQMSDQNKVDSQFNEFVNTVKESELEIAMLKSVNDAICKEREETLINLAKSNEIIHSQNEKLDQMTKELQRLETSLKESMRHIDTLQNESTSVLEENKVLKEKITKLEFNNKTHEKTVEIQSSMIKRLQKQKEEDNENYSSLKAELDTVKAALKSTKEELCSLQTLKEVLEIRVAELESGLDGGLKDILSTDAVDSNVRRRRQSIYDSKRQFGEDNNLDHSKADSIFSTRSKPDDLFLDCEDHSSNRSTPAKSSKRRESSVSKTDQSGEEASSRPSSVAAVRSRRQSIHDLHRSVRHTPSPRESLLGTVFKEDLEANSESAVAKLTSTLAACQQELEELKERYRELDEECETCAEYLHESDEQCMRLKKEKAALEDTIAELKGLSSNAPKRSCSNAAVNTDEDWTKLHSVVVDRMSFDAEVEKTKKLTKAIEEFRLKNRELRATNAKMHKALDKYAERDYNGVVKELQETKQQLESYKEKLAELQRQYKELDEECETCAEYLRARDEQILKLKEANLTLEKKLEEVQEADRSVCQSSRKKRRSLHDKNRASPHADCTDAATETTEDFLSYQVERDIARATDASDGTKHVKRLKELVEKLSQEKAYYEQQASRMPMYVATGSAIVQNQQITDVIKENQKLKKINAQLVSICKKRGKGQPDEQRENEPTEQG